MHHLILVRESAQGIAETECCGVPGSVPRCAGPGECDAIRRRQRAALLGAVYRAVRDAFDEGEVHITVIDPRNVFAFGPLVIRDAFRYRVPVRDAFRSLAAPSVATGIFDGQVLFRGRVPQPGEVVEAIRGRLTVHRVGAGPSV